MRLAVFSNPKACSAQQALPLVCEALRHQGAQVLTPEEPGPFPGNVSDRLIEACDAAIALGGDGTIIHVAKRAALLDKPVLGINGGHLGFMAGLEMGELSLLRRLLSGDYRVERRMMLEIGLKGRTYHALNEAVISRGALSRLIELKVQARGEPVSQYQADGVIVATPTGSTAYSLSAGGPVVDPALRCMLLTPVCPHALHSRSYLFPADTDLSVSAMTEENTPVYLTVDAEDNVVVDDACVTFRPAEKDACLIKLKPQSFYEILDQKLSHRR